MKWAPPDNRPTPDERDNCLPYLVRELELLTDVRVVVALGGVRLGRLPPGGWPPWGGGPGRDREFGHGAEAPIGPLTLLGPTTRRSRTPSPGG